METLEKISAEILKIHDAEDALSDLLLSAGCDSETEYTREYIELLNDLKDLHRDLCDLLAIHAETVTALESALDPLPGQAFNPHKREDIARACGL
jgi:hypothetical protein